jgi:hypothetical protein
MRQSGFFHIAYKSRIHQRIELFAQIVVVGARIAQQRRLEPGRKLGVAARISSTIFKRSMAPGNSSRDN